MTKRFCDICGKEIIFTKDKYSVSVDNARSDEKYSTSVPGGCSYCASSIYYYIEGLKKPLDKSTES